MSKTFHYTLDDLDAEAEAYAAAAEADLEQLMEECYMAKEINVKLTRNEIYDIANLVDNEIFVRTMQVEDYVRQGDEDGVSWCNAYITTLRGIMAKLSN